MSAKKEFKEVIAAAEKQGWRCDQSGKGGKWKLYAPDGTGIVHASATPSARRAVDNLVADLRRDGFIWKGH